jgi:hypothetical protein
VSAMRRTYLDTGVLIEAAAGKSTRALGLLKDPNRVFLSSPFLDLELLPQVIQNRQREQQKFLETYLAATKRIEDMRSIFRVAFRLGGERHGRPSRCGSVPAQGGRVHNDGKARQGDLQKWAGARASP